jgi:hypothetical protein
MAFSRQVKEIIRQIYLKPLLNAAHESGIHTVDAIRITLGLLHRYSRDALLENNAIARIENTDRAFKGSRLLTTPSCHAPLLAIVRFYFDPSVQQAIAPDNQPASAVQDALGGNNASQMVKNLIAELPVIRMQTEFRDICHEEINPIPGMSEAELRAMLKKNSGNNNPTILYALSAPIPLKVSKLFCGSAMREEITGDEVINSLTGTMYVFPSLYQAVERCMYNCHSRDKKYIQPLWAVIYKGTIEDLDFMETAYQGGGRPEFCGLSTRIDNAPLIPLRSVVLLPGKEFGKCDVMTTYAPQSGLELAASQSKPKI